MDLDHSLQEDEILDEWDVYINTELTPFLHLAPLPSSSLAGRFNSPSVSPLQARFKPQARRLELHLPFTDLSSENLAEDRLRDLQINEKGQKIVGAGWPWRRVQYLLGTFTTDGEMHMTPVESVIPLNVCLSHLDELDARLKGCSSSSLSNSSSGTASRRSHEDSPSSINPSITTTTPPTTAAPNKTIQVQFRKKETDEQVQARLNSFSYLQRRVDDEPWINLKHFSCTAAETVSVRDRLIGCIEREPLEFLAGEDYLLKVITCPSIESLTNI